MTTNVQTSVTCAQKPDPKWPNDPQDVLPMWGNLSLSELLGRAASDISGGGRTPPPASLASPRDVLMTFESGQLPVRHSASAWTIALAVAVRSDPRE